MADEDVRAPQNGFRCKSQKTNGNGSKLSRFVQGLDKSNPFDILYRKCERNSVGRVVASQAASRGFESRRSLFSISMVFIQ